MKKPITFQAHGWNVELRESSSLSDPWAPIIREWLRRASEPVTVGEILDGPLAFRPSYGRNR